MGTAEFNEGRIIIRSHIVTYGDAATEVLTEQIREEIEKMWNEPAATVAFKGGVFQVIFEITAELKPDLTELEVLQNTDPRNNYFRIEEYASGNISFVDGLGCNTGYFKVENLLPGWTTAAHEYGHTLGLEHPRDLDLRGKGVPGIMYPRGTLVDPQFQYDPSIPAGQRGGTMHPMYRKVQQADIDDLQLDRLLKSGQGVIVGSFTNIYHWNHAKEDDHFSGSPIHG